MRECEDAGAKKEAEAEPKHVPKLPLCLAKPTPWAVLLCVCERTNNQQTLPVHCRSALTTNCRKTKHL